MTPEPRAAWTLDQPLRALVKDRLTAFEVRETGDDGLRRAAVAIVLTGRPDGQAAILLTLRPPRMGRHAGQYALPGGKVDTGETLEEAALRELEEELGLTLGPGAVLGQLDDYPTRSGFRVSPFVVWAGARPVLTPAPDEVAQVFRIPFSELDSDAIPLFEDGVEGGPPVLYSNFPSVGTEMYSPTASIIYQFREVALRGLATRVAHFDQPRFAWR